MPPTDKYKYCNLIKPPKPQEKEAVGTKRTTKQLGLQNFFSGVKH